MTLGNSVQLWEMKHPGIKYFDGMKINAEINVDSLFNWLMYEYSSMETSEGDSGTFHDKVKYFFEIHDWNITKLVESTLLEYDPITDYRWIQTREMTDDTDKTENATASKSDKRDNEWSEKVKFKGTQINLVSAFNDIPSTLDNLHDTEKDRTITKNTTDTSGNSNETGNDNTESNKVGTIGEVLNETIARTGVQGKTYQELIEEERRQAEFNIYKWIGKHFCKELLIAIW